MRTYYVVAYDIGDPRRLRAIAALLAAYGMRLQKSVFLCLLSLSESRRVQRQLVSIMSPDRDSIRWYPFCKWCQQQLAERAPETTKLRASYIIV